MPFQTVSPKLEGTAPKLKITDVECHVLLAPDYDASFTSSAQDSFVIVIRTDGGVMNLVFCDVFEMRNAKIKKLTSYLMEIK